MPVYEYDCVDCGVFEEFHGLSESRQPRSCPHCGKTSPRIFSVIHLREMNPASRIAHERNERSAHAPHVCGSGCSHGTPRQKATSKSGKPALQSSTKRNRRPWMLGH